MSCVWILQRGHSGDGCVLTSTLCKYDLRKGDLFVLSWARVRRAFHPAHPMSSSIFSSPGHSIFTKKNTCISVYFVPHT